MRELDYSWKEENYNMIFGGNKKLKYRYLTNTDIKDGEYKEWYKDGSKKTIKNYKDGEQFGLLEGWHIDGTPSVYASFNEKGMINGVCKGWYENGNPMYEIYYQNGEEQGTRIDYYSNGKPTMLRNYINDLQVGEYIDFTSSWPTLTRQLTAEFNLQKVNSDFCPKFA